MRQSDYIAQVPVREELAPGDIIRSSEGKTYRTILMIEGNEAIVRSGAHSVDTLPIDSICNYWLKMIPKD